MAIKIYEKFAPRANPADGDYPHGSIKNESVPGAKDGTPLDAVWGNDMVGFTDALLAEAGIVPSGNPDKLGSSQRVEALHSIFDTYGTVVEINSGKFQVGQYVRLTDRAMGLFLVQSGGTADGFGTLDAGNGNTAVYVVDDGEIHVNHFGAKADGVTDDTIAIISAMRASEVYKGTVVFSGDYIYDTATAGGTQTFNLNRVDIKGYGRAVVSVKGTGTVWNINSNSQISTPDFSNITFINIGNAAVMCSFNVTFGQNIWGSSSKFHKVKVSFFKYTQLEFTQCFNCSFSRCEFNGADGTTYDGSRLAPAVVGATSSCIRITGGNPAWPGEVSISNLFHFKQCVFQNAKYGIDSYYLDKSCFDSCTFQYLWIGIKLEIDGINGDYNSSQITMSGHNYAEWIANRFISTVPILDDGVTEGTFTARGIVFSATRQYSHPSSWSGDNYISESSAINLVREDFAGKPSSSRNLMYAQEYNLDTVTSKELVIIDSNGRASFAGGVYFGELTLPNAITQNTEALKDFRHYYAIGAISDYVLSGLIADTPVVAVERIGNLTVCGFKLAGVQTGTNAIVIELTEPCEIVAGVTLNYCGVAATTNIFAKLIFGSSNKRIGLYKDSACTIALTANDLVSSGSTSVGFGITIFQ